MTPYPLLFKPVYQSYLWGGQRIGRHFQRAGVPPVCAESWELADRPEGMSVVCNGPLSGMPLDALLRRHGREILGPRHVGESFPLLIKVLDARERLSVQVHPNDASAARCGGEAKTEMWYILDAAPGACVFAGLRPGTTPAALRAALATNSVDALLNTISVKAGDAVFMPGGRVHAIGEGCLILEVQQNSNTTYRLYDWGRVDQQGRPRALHIDQALEVIDWADQPRPLVTPGPISHSAAGTVERILACPYFTMSRLVLQARLPYPRRGETCVMLFVASGSLTATAGAMGVRLDAGTTCLVPAACGTLDLEPLNGPASALVITP
ncbi:MAG: class I mannose-6-phosphate isomerase [Lentisphaerae bacterium]|nr:class I mannose-6-phosphate isomerase [Lentisphaerota bacterium]